MNAGARTADRILIAIVAAIAGLVVIALAVVFTRGEPEALDPATPAGVVQRYSTAVIDGDLTTADAYLTDAARTSCSGFRDGGPVPERVVLISTTERETSATVKVSITESDAGGGPFGPSEYQAEDRFSLVKVDNAWLIDQAPYQLLSCSGTGLKR
jgi:hypothetical protein